MIDIFDDSIIAPDRYLKDSSSNFTIEINPNFISWKNREQAMFTFINSTLSPAILALTCGHNEGVAPWFCNGLGTMNIVSFRGKTIDLITRDMSLEF